MAAPHPRVGKAKDEKEGMSMLDVGVRQTSDMNIPDEQDWPGVIITGSCSGSGFVPAKVLICAGSLGTEAAIRAWLELRGIRTAG